MAAAAAVASVLLEAAGRDARLHGLHAATLQPGGELVRLHDDDAAVHAGVVGTAVFGAKQMEFAGLRWREPDRRIAAGDDILLDAESRDVEAVDHVLGGHYQP